MSQYTLTLLDVAGIQDYIFASNVLRENIGASELVRRATHDWPFQIVREIGPTNVTDNLELEEAKVIEDGRLAAEVVYAGGGNCVILFADPDHARQFITKLNLLILTQAPGLELVAHHIDDYEWDTGKLANTLKQALDDLAAKKLNRRASLPALSMGTAVACQSSGLPAVGSDPDEPTPRLLSAPVLAKLAALEDANRRLRDLLPFRREDAEFTIPYDFDNFGRRHGEISYIAVVHADGNRMGQRLRNLRAAMQGHSDRSYVRAIRAFSGAIELAARQALKNLGLHLMEYWEIDRDNKDVIVERVRNDQGDWVELGGIVLDIDERTRRPFMPFRPIVFGGDDLTFVCDGRLGLGLTAAYLGLFEQAVSDQVNQLANSEPEACEALRGLTASAGVAIVKTHYPFARAYALANELRENAKHLGSAMDWHFAAAGLFGAIDDIRARQFMAPAGYLAMRPIRLAATSEPVSSADGVPVEDYSKATLPWQAWPNFARVTLEFAAGSQWRDKHNKVIALRQALRDGPLAVSKFRSAYGLANLPEIDPADTAQQTTGWCEKPDTRHGFRRCGYFDAIEALEFFMPLRRQDGAK